MGRKPPPEGKRFKPGQSGNPGGKAKVPEDILKARKLNQLELERIVNQYLWLSAAELKARVQDPATPTMELMVASVIAEAVKKGDQQRLEFILCRMIGKVTERLEVDIPVPFIVHRRDGSKVIMGAEKKEKED